STGCPARKCRRITRQSESGCGQHSTHPGPGLVVDVVVTGVGSVVVGPGPHFKRQIAQSMAPPSPPWAYAGPLRRTARQISASLQRIRSSITLNSEANGTLVGRGRGPLLRKGI